MQKKKKEKKEKKRKKRKKRKKEEKEKKEKKSIFRLLRPSEQAKWLEFVIQIIPRSIIIVKNDVSMLYFEI